MYEIFQWSYGQCSGHGDVAIFEDRQPVTVSKCMIKVHCLFYCLALFVAGLVSSKNLIEIVYVFYVAVMKPFKCFCYGVSNVAVW